MQKQFKVVHAGTSDEVVEYVRFNNYYDAVEYAHYLASDGMRHGEIEGDHENPEEVEDAANELFEVEEE